MLDKQRSIRFGLMFLFCIVLLAGASFEIFNLGLKSGNWLGTFSFKWFIAFALFEVFCLALLASILTAFLSPDRKWILVRKLLALRPKNPLGRWGASILVALLLPWLILYSPWNNLLFGIYLRILLLTFTLLIITTLLAEQKTATWSSFGAAIILVGVLMVLAQAFSTVSDYPFSLYWSEGNRFWDYSLRFGRERYNYPPGEPIKAQIDKGRQILWGLPFLSSDLTIWQMRLWDAILFTIPYILLGMVVISYRKNSWKVWFLFSLWVLTFLTQGPIYTPLVLIAFMVVLVRQAPLWASLPIVALAANFAFQSRTTWIFAAPFWAILIAMNLSGVEGRHLKRKDWLQAATLGLGGFLGGYGWNVLGSLFTGTAERVSFSTPSTSGKLVEVLRYISFEWFTQRISNQPLIWSRLWPNATYPPGIVLGLIIATLPLILLFSYIIKKQYWKPNIWQILAFSGPLFAFLVVGLIASIKIGGGSNLHNLDMFLITLVIISGLAWDTGFGSKIVQHLHASAWIRLLILLVVLVPTATSVITATPTILPTQVEIDDALANIRAYTSCANQYGEVLFMDQRQLLTFGFVENIPLVAEYEKKYVADRVMAGNEEYFSGFYDDLNIKRFALIITDRQPVAIQDFSGEDFSNENNLWYQWVTEPLLEEYEMVDHFKKNHIELYMPINRTYSCP
jgi:hypothetical protein